MSFRFQRRIKILPGVRLNISKGGVSTSVGVRGARATLGRGGRRVTVGLPGTGISHTTVAKAPPRFANAPGAPDARRTSSVAAGRALGRGVRCLWARIVWVIAVASLLVIALKVAGTI